MSMGSSSRGVTHFSPPTPQHAGMLLAQRRQLRAETSLAITQALAAGSAEEASSALQRSSRETLRLVAAGASARGRLTELLQAARHERVGVGLPPPPLGLDERGVRELDALLQVVCAGGSSGYDASGASSGCATEVAGEARPWSRGGGVAGVGTTAKLRWRAPLAAAKPQPLAVPIAAAEELGGLRRLHRAQGEGALVCSFHSDDGAGDSERSGGEEGTRPWHSVSPRREGRGRGGGLRPASAAPAPRRASTLAQPVRVRPSEQLASVASHALSRAPSLSATVMRCRALPRPATAPAAQAASTRRGAQAPQSLMLAVEGRACL